MADAENGCDNAAASISGVDKTVNPDQTYENVDDHRVYIYHINHIHLKGGDNFTLAVRNYISMGSRRMFILPLHIRALPCSCLLVLTIAGRLLVMVPFILKRYKTEKRVANKCKVASNKIFSMSNEQYILRQVKTEPFLSPSKIAEIAERDLEKNFAHKQ
ncbi:hypothetical protein GQX74_010084 [Glossina fuscipes]|nr:hypothetical protein GQX74_010084 [Glossina fuscipes]